jgi:heme-degrading monooxygenase HmoA
LIARIWSAQSTPAQAPAYADHLRSRVLPELTKLEGYSGAMLLERPDAGTVEIIVMTFWRSADSIRAFAGTDLERAVVEDEAVPLLTRFDRRVRHYEIAVTDHPQSAGGGPESVPDK